MRTLPFSIFPSEIRRFLYCVKKHKFFNPVLNLSAFALLWAILSAVLATRRGRNAWNWFFLSCFYGILGFLLLVCSRTINQGEYKESDTMSKVLWTIFFIPIIIVIMYCIIVLPKKREDEELTRKVQREYGN